MGSPIHQLLPYVQFCASTVIQEALARTLARADEPYEGHPSYYQYLNAKYRQKRALLEALPAAKQGGIHHPAAPGGVARTDWALCQWMAEERGVLCIPSSPFFSRERAMA